MSTALHDLKNQALIGASVYPATVNDTINGSAIDMIDADGRCFAIQVIGTVGGTSPSLAGKIQESSDNSTWTDVTGATFTAVTASNNVQTITFDRTKRYVRHAPDGGRHVPDVPLAVVDRGAEEDGLVPEFQVIRFEVGTWNSSSDPDYWITWNSELGISHVPRHPRQRQSPPRHHDERRRHAARAAAGLGRQGRSRTTATATSTAARSPSTSPAGRSSSTCGTSRWRRSRA